MLLILGTMRRAYFNYARIAILINKEVERKKKE